MNILKAQGITRTVNGRRLLEPTDVEMRPGAVTVMLGPNGAGKSTLLKCLSFVEPPDAGSITIGQESFHFPLHSGIRPPWPRITAVFQGLHLWPHLTVRENILLPERARHRVMAEPGLLESMLGEFALEGLVDRRPHELSGGERLRTALARAVVLAPRFLLLDEPTASLDVQSIRKLTIYLRSLADNGMAIIVVTHLLGFARQVADDIIFVSAGRIAERGSVNLLANPNTPEFVAFLSMY
jgi:polar amino acid transport system ATP-binding protein